jgi:glycosyltransferase involved in cell wall biosynthesis
MLMKKLAIVTTHPIQYYAPLFRLLNARANLMVRVFYTSELGRSDFDKDFGKAVKWDIPLLEGYDHSSVPGKDYRAVIKAIEGWEAGAVMIIGWNNPGHLRCMRHFKKRIPVFFRGDSTLLDERSGIKRILRHTFLRWVYSYVDAAFYVGTNNKKYFQAAGLRESQLIFAPHSIDNDRFEDKDGAYTGKARQWRKELWIDEDATIFVFVGKFQEKKNPLLLIDAFQSFKEYKAHLLLVGDGELESAMRAAAAGNKNISFIPFTNQSVMPVVYRLGDVFCLPSKGPEETWGLAVNEAMACQRPVLVSNRCGCAIDLVTNGLNGFIFASGDKEDLVTKMRLFLHDPGVLKAMGEASRTIIRSWSYEQAAPAIEKAIIR